MAGKKGLDVQREILKDAQSKNPDLSVALVGENKDFVDLFYVLKQLKLAENFQDEVSKDTGAAKQDKDKKLKPANPNMVKDKKTGQKYLVDPMPSVIISVTGDAQDMPEDHEFIASVDDLMKYMGESRGIFKLNREAASRAISMMTANKKEKIQEKIDELRRLAQTDYFDIALLHYQHFATWPKDSMRWQDGISEARVKQAIVGQGASVHGLPALRQMPGNKWCSI